VVASKVGARGLPLAGKRICAIVEIDAKRWEQMQSTCLMYESDGTEVVTGGEDRC
jgi:hypothetical protein